MYIIAHPFQLHVELGGFFQCRFDTADICYLAADMEMYQLQAISHLIFLEHLECFQQFARVQAELAHVASRFFPFATAGTCQLDPDTDIRANFQTLGYSRYIPQLVQLLYHEVNVPSHLLCQQCQLDIVLVLVSVTDNHGIVVNVDGQDSVQFRLGACLQPDIILCTMTYNLLHDRTHLVHLDRVDNKVLPRITIFRGSCLETT